MNGIVWTGNVNEDFFGKDNAITEHTVRLVVRLDDPYYGEHPVDFKVKKDDKGLQAAKSLMTAWEAAYGGGPFVSLVGEAVLFAGSVTGIEVNGEIVQKRKKDVPKIVGLKMAQV